MKIQSNDIVLVKLTPSGKIKLLNALADQAQEINRNKKFGKQYTAQDFMPTENADGEVRMTFWEVASLLFRDSCNGSTPTVEYLKTLEGPDSRELLKATVSTLVHNAHNEVSSWIYGMDADIGGRGSRKIRTAGLHNRVQPHTSRGRSTASGSCSGIHST